MHNEGQYMVAAILYIQNRPAALKTVNEGFEEPTSYHYSLFLRPKRWSDSRSSPLFRTYGFPRICFVDVPHLSIPGSVTFYFFGKWPHESWLQYQTEWVPMVSGGLAIKPVLPLANVDSSEMINDLKKAWMSQNVLW